MSPPGCQKMSAKPCNRNAEKRFPVLSLKSREQKPPNPLLIQDKNVLQPSAEPLGELPKRLAIADASSLGDAIEIIRRHEFGVDGEGDRRRHVELSDLLSDITRDELDGRLHFRHHPLGFLDAFHAALAEPF